MSSGAFGGLSFAEIIEKLQTDKTFSTAFEAVVLQASVQPDGLNSPAGRSLLRFFAKDEQELAQLISEANVLKNVLALNRRATVDTTVARTSPGTGTTGSVACLFAELSGDEKALAAAPFAADEQKEQ
jgi:hypothetical protein